MRLVILADSLLLPSAPRPTADEHAKDLTLHHHPHLDLDNNIYCIIIMPEINAPTQQQPMEAPASEVVSQQPVCSTP